MPKRIIIMTVKELKEFLKDIPDDTPVVVSECRNPNLTQIKYVCERGLNREIKLLNIF